jgi:hypothetical protein
MYNIQTSSNARPFQNLPISGFLALKIYLPSGNPLPKLAKPQLNWAIYIITETFFTSYANELALVGL